PDQPRDRGRREHLARRCRLVSAGPSGARIHDRNGPGRRLGQGDDRDAAVLRARHDAGQRPGDHPPGAPGPVERPVPTIRLVPRRLAILGSTGSIGCQALDVVSRAPDHGLTVVALSASSAWEQLIEQAQAYGVRRIALSDPDAAARASEAWT